MKPVRFEPEVHEDIAGNLEWYGAQNPRLPEAFLLELRSLVSLISDSPQMASVTYRGLRRAVLRRFPYCVYYSASPDEVRVVAVLHGRRNVRPLRSRLDSELRLPPDEAGLPGLGPWVHHGSTSSEASKCAVQRASQRNALTLGRPMKHVTLLRNVLWTSLPSWHPVSFALTLLVITGACITPAGCTSAAIERSANQPDVAALALPPDAPISQFVRRIHEDRRGHMWFGTNGDGVARWDGEALEYFSLPQGFSGVAVRGIVEDADGSIWFGTEGGVTKFDGASFTNYTVRDGLISNDVWCLAFDRRGELWVGTLEGVCRFDGTRFTPFELPEAEPDPFVGVTSARIVRSIVEDRAGRLWFGTNGGAYVYDGTLLRNYNEADGLSNDNVNCILEDRSGRIWFATHHNGVCYLDGETFTAVTDADGVEGTEVWDLFMDRAGDIWFPVENSGLYRFNGNTFQRYSEAQGLTSNAIQCTYQGLDGRLWFGGHLGLFRLEGESIVAVTRVGPWR